MPPNSTLPAVGSMRRERQRTKVDLPDPLKPMSTRISPGMTSSVAATTAGIYPAFFTASAVGSPLWRLRNFAGSGPYNFQTSRHEIIASLLMRRSAYFPRKPSGRWGDKSPRRHL